MGPNENRICGVDAPEHDVSGYFASALALNGIAEGKRVRCPQVGIGRGTPCDRRSQPTNHGRFVGADDIADVPIARGCSGNGRRRR